MSLVIDLQPCPECGILKANNQALAQHRLKKHGVRGKQTIIRERARAVVGWWDQLDAAKADSVEATIRATQEMDRRMNALREALER